MPADENETFQQPALSPTGPRSAPGVLVVWSNGAPASTPYPLDRPRTIGRSTSADIPLPHDIAVSTRHCEVSFANGRTTVRDLDSRNGTFANGTRLTGTATFERPPILRIGNTLLEIRPDLTGYDVPTAIEDGYVVSPHLRTAIARAIWAAERNYPLLVRGETGAGKEYVARAFHLRGPRAKGPFVVESCANLNETIAEAELFGTRRGAFTGAVDKEGLIARADGGTLYLDELAELAPGVQTMLLRVFEQKEVRAVGSKTTHVVDFALCVATNIDLEAEAAAGKFRDELSARVDKATVQLLPLRERRDEIPFLIAHHALVRSGEVKVTLDFVEACLLRAWPRNVRGIDAAITRAAQGAAVERPPRTELGARDLEPERSASIAPASAEDEPTKLRRMLREANGNAAAVARQLGIAKTTLAYRLRKYGVEV